MDKHSLEQPEIGQDTSLPIHLSSSFDDSMYKDPTEMETLFVEVMNYVKNLESYDYSIISLRRGENLSEGETDVYFRRFERNQYNVWILQYLVSFTSRLPMHKDIAQDLADPFSQFKSFVYYNLNLLQEEDVVHLIFEYLKSRKLISPSNYKYFKVWLFKKWKKWSNMMQSANEPLKENWQQVFAVLKEFASFWFSVRGEHENLNRKADFFMYHLSNILIRLNF